MSFVPVGGNQWRLSVEDDGVGLSACEIFRLSHQLRLTSSRGDTLELWDGGLTNNPLQSCFVVGSQVTVTSNQLNGPSGGTLVLHWSPDDGVSLCQSPVPSDAGGAVHLTVGNRFDGICDLASILWLFRKYSEFSLVKIEFLGCGNLEVPLSVSTFPWELEQCRRLSWVPQGMAVDFAENTRFRHAEGRACDAAWERLDKGRRAFLTGFYFRCDELGVSGIACVLAEPASVLANRRHTVFFQGILLSDEVDSLAPWDMPFLSCVINSTAPRLSSARVGVGGGCSACDSIRHSVRASFLEFILKLQRRDTETFERVVRTHFRAFKRLGTELRPVSSAIDALIAARRRQRNLQSDRNCLFQSGQNLSGQIDRPRSAYVCDRQSMDYMKWRAPMWRWA